MDAKMFECSICLQTCNRVVNCTKCNQILCKAHVRKLPRKACPMCRDEHARFEANVALQRIIDDYRARTGAPPCEDDLSDDDAQSTTASEDSIFARTRSASLVSGEVETRYGRKIPRPGFNGEFKKDPNQAHDAVMREHARSCTHAGCNQVWSGRWGSYIGGRRGETHFDLTQCPEGKALNVLLGWNYENPTR
eukprot:TRINITY_DN6428_c0_g1_i1.p1 TRINITY_DN6428_c0_g1~~TRINITY_DN6428_c0_g1_i1.p1  ORF type:complete len:215 (-),score=30.09 TRINITY_DN6428_c0_g1_i1:378-956(-)